MLKSQVLLILLAIDPHPVHTIRFMMRSIDLHNNEAPSSSTARLSIRRKQSYKYHTLINIPNHELIIYRISIKVKNSPSKTATTINVTQFAKLPLISTGRRPNRSMVNRHANCAMSASTLLMAWYFSAFSAEMPICAKMGTEKYWIAETPVSWIEAWIEQARKRRRKADLNRQALLMNW